MGHDTQESFMKILEKRDNNYSKQEIIEAVKWRFGMTKEEALRYYSKTDASTLDEIADGYFNNAKLSFYND